MNIDPETNSSNWKTFWFALGLAANVRFLVIVPAERMNVGATGISGK
jgi:hypothetical protein